jgi:hypothetical protein
VHETAVNRLEQHHSPAADEGSVQQPRDARQLLAIAAGDRSNAPTSSRSNIDYTR